MISYPIAIMSFDRPGYLARVLNALKQQKDVNIDETDIHLFQDGSRSAITGEIKGNQSDIDACVAMFRAFYPNGVVHRSDSNIGIALNYQRAEEYIFLKRDREIGFFLEDDLEIGNYYFKIMYRLASFSVRHDSVGYFAAYGHHRASLAEQNQHRNEIICMAHNWAFGLTRRCWVMSRPYVLEYLNLLKEIDYRQRPTEEIKQLFTGWGCGAPGSSQDVAKTLACYLVGLRKINTYEVFGRYIGREGFHSTDAQYEAEGFGSTVLTESRDFDCRSIGQGSLDACYSILKNYCSTVSI